MIPKEHPARYIVESWVDYYRPVSAWNIGKQSEFKDRYLYDENTILNALSKASETEQK